MPKKTDFYMESGINRRGNVTIELSPATFDMLINELREFKDMLVNTVVLENYGKTDTSEMTEIISRNFPATMTLSCHPNCGEFFNPKNNKGTC